MFDIRQSIYDKHEEIDEERTGEYIEGLMEEFAASPEAQPVIDQFGRLGWAATMMDYSINYFGETPATMSLASFDEVVFDIFPRKVSTEPDSAAEIISELRAFWSFVHRQYALPNAAKIIATLDDQAAGRLRDELADSSYWGMAKSFVMMGSKAGFDMTSQRGAEEFMAVYNANRLANRSGLIRPHAGREYPAEPHFMSHLTISGGSPSNLRSDRRRKRKLQRQARKRNRR